MPHPPSPHPQGDNRKYLLHYALSLLLQVLFHIGHITAQSTQVPKCMHYHPCQSPIAHLHALDTCLCVSWIGTSATTRFDFSVGWYPLQNYHVAVLVTPLQQMTALFHRPLGPSKALMIAHAIGHCFPSPRPFIAFRLLNIPQNIYS